MPADPSITARCFAIVPCAGTGSRAASPEPKQYVALAGEPMVMHTLRALQGVARLETVLVAVAAGDDAFASRLSLPSGGRFVVSPCGGATRADTVAAGLEALRAQGANDADWVLVHDAARCLVQPAWIDRLIDACVDDPVGGLLAVPVADTLKRESAGRVSTTLMRDAVWQAQTPQMFRLGVLAQALSAAAAGATVTDEAGAIERLGLEPKLVVGSPENIKVTHRADFGLAEAILKGRRA